VTVEADSEVSYGLGQKWLYATNYRKHQHTRFIWVRRHYIFKQERYLKKWYSYWIPYASGMTMTLGSPAILNSRVECVYSINRKYWLQTIPEKRMSAYVLWITAKCMV